MDNEFHIEIKMNYDYDNLQKIDDVYECQQKLREWIGLSPISYLTFHGIEDGICCNAGLSYNKALEYYEYIKNYQLLDELRNIYNIDIEVHKPWNGLQIKPYWFEGSEDEWINRRT